MHGRRCPIAGTVTMDQLMVDVGDPPVEVGDEVVLIGRQGDEEITAAEWAHAMARSPTRSCAASARACRGGTSSEPRRTGIAKVAGTAIGVAGAVAGAAYARQRLVAAAAAFAARRRRERAGSTQPIYDRPTPRRVTTAASI